ncbi:hypothetical protein [Streptomyces sp. NRRL B-1381]|uniref:hypothetical protein n=1 Tax=Streptomyces TaxID=1883 RepID=UPI00067DD6C7|nr:hypothetical protein [Streptomyces sp. NRRL B-1381]
MVSRAAASARDCGPLVRGFEGRLRRLIEATYPDVEKRPGFAAIAQSIRETTGRGFSSTYLWELATGKKSNVTLEQLDILAEYFAVPPEYFLHGEASKALGIEPELLVALGDPRVRALVLQVRGLSGACLDALLAMAGAARTLENLPAVPQDSPLSDVLN